MGPEPNGALLNFSTSPHIFTDQAESHNAYEDYVFFDFCDLASKVLLKPFSEVHGNVVLFCYWSFAR